MKLYFLLSIVLTLSSTSVQAEEAVWVSSYQLERLGRYNDAIAAIDRVPANGLDAELKAIRRGWLYYLSGAFDLSIREYRLAIERNRKSIDARLGVTLPLLAQMRWREAEQNAKAVLDMAPNNYVALLRLILAQEAQHDWEDMEITSAAMAASYPLDASGYVYLARANARLNRRENAVAAYTAVLSLIPGHLEAIAYLEKK